MEWSHVYDKKKGFLRLLIEDEVFSHWQDNLAPHSWFASSSRGNSYKVLDDFVMVPQLSFFQ